MAKETLYCETGNHKWTRESKRGRKPTTCEKHPRAHVVLANNSSEAIVKLHCEIGDHDWERPAQRGAKPRNCPKHKPVTPQGKRLVDPQAGNVMRVLHCEIGNHEWKRAPQRGRVPINCPEHKPTAKPVDNLADNEVLLSEYDNGDAMVLILDEDFYASLPTIEQTPELSKAQKEEIAFAKSRAKVDHLEKSLKDHGTHISQQAPYQLFKLVGGQYEYVRDFSPLAKAQFQNQFPDRFKAGIYFFKRDGIQLDPEED